MTDRELMQQALEALDCLQPSAWEVSDRMGADTDKAITALRERLAQPVCCCQEPDTPGIVHRIDGPCYVREQPEQEPVAWLSDDGNVLFGPGPKGKYKRPLYTTPPRREWVGLTEEEVDECYYWKDRQWTTDELVRHVEAKLREKNA